MKAYHVARKKNTIFKPLTGAQKQQNTILSRNRIFVEHIFGYMKNYHILSDKFRGSRSLVYDSFEINISSIST